MKENSKSKDPIYITSPIFYANNIPHIGHVYTGLFCDAWKKFNFVFGNDVIFTSGMDEHGQKVMQSAQKNGCNSQKYVDDINEKFKECFKNYNVEYTNWIRTTDVKHEEVVVQIWNKLMENGYIYKDKYEGWYSISDEHYIEGGKDDFEATDKIVWREESCYYFKLSAFEGKLIKYYEENNDAVAPISRYNEVIGFLKQGLKDFSVSRPKERLSWGIEVPNDPDQVIYVWIDALVSYLSSVNYPNDEYKKLWPATHFIGKDILKFHAIYWPAILMASDLPLPKKLVVHGWWLNGDQKISKSLNNAIDIDYYSINYGYDALRFHLLSSMRLGDDCSFKDDLFLKNVESMLSNKFGNLFSRLIGVAISKKINVVKYSVIDDSLIYILKKISLFSKKMLDNIELFDEYTNLFSEFSDILNSYVDNKEIWKLTGEKLNNELYGLLYCYKVISTFFYPLIPASVLKILSYFDCEVSYESVIKHDDIKINENIILFPRKKL